MSQIHDRPSKLILGCGLALALLTPLNCAHADSIHVLYSFTGASGSTPYGNLIKYQGNFYSTTAAGGAYGYGTVFELSPKGKETLLYSFTGGSDGAYPEAGLITDGHGNFYSTTYQGGSGTGCSGGCGTVFKLTLAKGKWKEKTLYSFTGGNDGANPYAGLIADKEGNFYSTTLNGGLHNFGVVFKLAPDRAETPLYSFTGGNDGANPTDSLIMDRAGILYGTAQLGGADTAGTVFEISPDGTETTLYTFCGQQNCTDGSLPFAGLMMDGRKNLYGTTITGH